MATEATSLNEMRKDRGRFAFGAVSRPADSNELPPELKHGRVAVDRDTTVRQIRSVPYEAIEV